MARNFRLSQGRFEIKTLFKNSSSLSISLFPFFHPLLSPSKITPLLNDKGVKPPLCYHFLSPSFLSPNRRDRLKRQVNESDEIVVEERNSSVVRVHSPWNFYLCRGITGNSIRAPSLCIRLNKWLHSNPFPFVILCSWRVKYCEHAGCLFVFVIVPPYSCSFLFLTLNAFICGKDSSFCSCLLLFQVKCLKCLDYITLRKERRGLN